MSKLKTWKKEILSFSVYNLKKFYFNFDEIQFNLLTHLERKTAPDNICRNWAK